MKEKLKKYEARERELTDTLFRTIGTIKSYTFTQGRICYDGHFTTVNDTNVLFEVKVRDFEVNKYPDFILQTDKLLNLIKRSKTMGIGHIYYINYFKTSDPTIFSYIVFNLTARIEEWKKTKVPVIKKYMNNETYKSTTYKVEKAVVMLKFNSNIDQQGHFNLN